MAPKIGIQVLVDDALVTVARAITDVPLGVVRTKPLHEPLANRDAIRGHIDTVIALRQRLA